MLESPYQDCYNDNMKLRFVPNVPNILTLIRFLAIPVLAYLIYAGDDYNFAAFLLFVGIWLTDMLDGFIARKFNQITEFGKLFDPLADKLFQLTTAVMMCVVGKLPIWVPLVIFFRELLMIIGSALLFKKESTVVFAQWYGKVGTVLFVVAFASLFFLTKDQSRLANYIFIVPILWSLYACLRYAMAYLQPLVRKWFKPEQPDG
ncbi:MAG: CDP-alcohol phosphatidyltransferase family protein [Clostridiaceae bacterium]|jgi:cardiolipin synthase|nr:CDP-alcohol phosphatidyltransferase family protein [Clostridiaceae bacterium]